MIEIDGRRSALLAAAAAVVAHVTALVGGFVWLDHAHLQERLALAAPRAWPALFSHGFAGTGFYRPLVALSLSLDAALGGAPWLFHAVTLLWHAATAALVVLAARELGLSQRAATLAGALFAVHPATSLVASAIAFRSEAMIAVALLALVICHRRGNVLGASLALLAGALTKETALVLGPLFVLALEVERKGRRWRLLGAEAAAVGLALALRLAFAPAWRASFPTMNAGQAIALRLAALGKGALLLVLPIDRSVCDAFPLASWGHAALGAAVVAGVALLARRPGPARLLALSLLPALNLVPIMRWWSPHYFYLPLAFAAMLAARAIETLAGRALWAPAIALAALAALSLHDDLRFRTAATLWQPVVAAQPACREGHFYLGEHARERQRWDEAAAHYERALAETPGVLSYVDRGAALQNLGAARLAQGRFADARESFTAALVAVIDPTARRRITHNLAVAELRAGHPAEAARLLEPETARPDAFPESIFIRARALHDLGREAEASALVRRLRTR